MKTLRIKYEDNCAIYNIYNIKSIVFTSETLYINLNSYLEEYDIKKFNKSNIIKDTIIKLFETNFDYAFVEINCNNGTINYCLN